MIHHHKLFVVNIHMRAGTTSYFCDAFSIPSLLESVAVQISLIWPLNTKRVALWSNTNMVSAPSKERGYDMDSWL